MFEDWHMHAQQHHVQLINAKNSHILRVPHSSPQSKYYFSSKNMAPGLPRLALKKVTAKTYFLHYDI